MADAGRGTQPGNAFLVQKTEQTKGRELSYANAFGVILAPEFLEASEFRKADFLVRKAMPARKGYLAVGMSGADSCAVEVAGSRCGGETRLE